METCTVRWSIWRNGAVGLIGFAFTSIAALALHSNDKDQFHALLISLSFGPVALLFGYRTLDRKPTLIVDAQGMTLPRYGLIHWDAIDKVGVAPGLMVLIFPKRPEDWQSKLPAFYALMWRLFPKRRTLGVSLQNVDTLMPAIYNAIKVYLSEESTERGLLLLRRENPSLIRPTISANRIGV